MFDPYNYSFHGMTDEEFNSFYADEDEAEMERQLIDLIGDGKMLFRTIKDVIEGSDFYLKNPENEKIKNYLEKIDKIEGLLNDFFK